MSHDPITATRYRTCKLRLTHRLLPKLLAHFQGGGGDFRVWHKADIPAVLNYVRFRSKTDIAQTPEDALLVCNHLPMIRARDQMGQIMNNDRNDRQLISRRVALTGAALALRAAADAAAVQQAAARQKISQAYAKCQSTPKGNQCCDGCISFQSPNAERRRVRLRIGCDHRSARSPPGSLLRSEPMSAFGT
jgi:hypothetical protein